MSHHSRRQRPNPSASTKAAVGKTAAAWRVSSRLTWGFLAAGVVVGAIWWFAGRRPDSPPPDVSTARLDPAAARLVEQLLAAVRSMPRSGDAWGKLGAILKSFEYGDQARRCFEIAQRLDPKEPRWPYLHGALLVAESPPAAIAQWRHAVALCGSEPDAPRLRLAKLLAETGQPAAARRELDALLRDKPGHSSALLALAHMAHVQGATREAISLASRCTNDHHTARAAWTLLAALHLRSGATNAARDAIIRANTLPPDASVVDPFELEVLGLRTDPREISDRAQRLLMTGQIAEAQPLAEQLVREHPAFAEGWLLLGRWRVLRKEFPAAEAAIRRHLELDPSSVNGLFQLGMALMGGNRHAEAVPIFELAIQLKPDFGPAFFNLGFALARAGRQQEALPAFRAAIRHNPERIDSYILLADLHLQLGQIGEATELARLAEALDATDRRLDALREKMKRAGR